MGHARVRSHATRPGLLTVREHEVGGEGDKPPECLLDKPVHRGMQGAACTEARHAAVGPAAAVSTTLTTRGYPAHVLDKDKDKDESGPAEDEDVLLVRSLLVHGHPRIFEAMKNVSGGLGLGLGLDIDGGMDDDDDEHAACGVEVQIVQLTMNHGCTPSVKSMPVHQYAYHAAGDDDVLKAELAHTCCAYTRAILQLHVQVEMEARCAPPPPANPARAFSPECTRRDTD
ncbi:hypothetical protein WOLCODRAFT_149489 [Wolfiporia cocos MD-104 SS10]|uniref:Uncharacterized protein n=1 Tax=Wolfiporia cocos (strain MD-104) TaxID=742152 RepID=A0A2H3J8K1_WOLCO|nr:hypothetical protein WOLCODRAFT_149489 [Wolfiporia cocos MD-104 SS10]